MEQLFGTVVQVFGRAIQLSGTVVRVFRREVQSSTSFQKSGTTFVKSCTTFDKTGIPVRGGPDDTWGGYVFPPCKLFLFFASNQKQTFFSFQAKEQAHFPRYNLTFLPVFWKTFDFFTVCWTNYFFYHVLLNNFCFPKNPIAPPTYHLVGPYDIRIVTYGPWCGPLVKRKFSHSEQMRRREMHVTYGPR